MNPIKEEEDPLSSITMTYQGRRADILQELGRTMAYLDWLCEEMADLQFLCMLQLELRATIRRLVQHANGGLNIDLDLQQE